MLFLIKNLLVKFGRCTFKCSSYSGWKLDYRNLFEDNFSLGFLTVTSGCISTFSEKTMQEANELSEQPILVFSKNDELRNKENFFGNYEVDRSEKPHTSHHWLSRDIAQKNVFQYTPFSQLTIWTQ